MQNEGEAREIGTRYESLLLRIWHRNGPDVPDWTFRVEHLQEGTALRFSEPDALIAYLWAIIGPHGSLGTARAEHSFAGEQHGAGALGDGEDTAGTH